MLVSLLAFGLLAHPSQPAQKPEIFEFEVKTGSGLTVKMGGMPVIRGSWFQYYAPGWTKGYYSSQWNIQKVEKLDANTYKMSFGGSGQVVFGNAVFHRDGDRLQVNYEFGYNSKEPALIEFTPGLLWATPWKNGTITCDGSVYQLGTVPDIKVEEKDRHLGPDARNLNFEGPGGEFSVKSDIPITTFDARNYDQDWAEGKQLLWQGFGALPLVEGKTTKVALEYRFKTPANSAESIQTADATLKKIPNAVVPNDKMPILIPKPKHATLDWDHPLEISGLWRFPAGKVKFFDTFKADLERKFEMPVLDGTKSRISFDGGISRLHITPGGYQLKITREGTVSVLGEEAEGLLNGLYRLSSLAFWKNGKIWFPTGEIEDVPATQFRGVHLFVGKQARPFQMKLWDRVLRPLMMNKIVLQCEQTKWDALPGTESPITMPKEDLVKLFNDYRKIEVEPIPLIQSFGHMEWFFRNDKNLELAYNPLIPYSIDPRKPEAIKLISKVWDEACIALDPKTIHFGLDEVDMRGFDKTDPALVTELWQKIMPELNKIAKSHEARMIIWGDKALAPNEAIDAALGDNNDEAKKRREAIPKGTWIADWHYQPEQNTTPFLKSLQTWKLDNFWPIATTWYRPENIRGFTLAANLERAGSLQTTWAGYESSEKAMLAQLKQFTSMVLTADYSWSGRQELVEKLPYKPEEIFAQMYNPVQSPILPQPGLTVGLTEPLKIGRYSFGTMTPVSLRNLAPGGATAPTEIRWPVKVKTSKLALAISTKIIADDAEPMADLVIIHADGTRSTETLFYGLHARGPGDVAACFYGKNIDGKTVVQFDLGAKPIKEIRLVSRNSYVGLTVHGMTFLP